MVNAQQPNRIRHIESISIRNLTLNPLRDHLSSLLLPAVLPPPNPNAPRSKFAQDDTDLLLQRRRRTNSTASVTNTTSRVLPLEWHEAERERAEIAAIGKGTESVTAAQSSVTAAQSIVQSINMERRKSLTRSLKRGMNAEGIEEEVEPASPPSQGTFDTAASRFVEPPPFFPPALRRRSTSRASATSVATTNSAASTIRLHPRVAHDNASLHSERSRGGITGRTSYTSDAQLRKEKSRRIEIIKRRLVDSRITLSLAPPVIPSDPTPPATNGRGKISRSNSSNSIGRKTRQRSSPSSPSRSLLSSPAASTSTLPPLPPFFVSTAQHSTTHPCFEIDPSDFVADAVLEGEAEGEIMVGVWTRAAELGKGKGKDIGMEGWKLLEEVRIELSSLVSIGHDPTEFPPLLPNSLIFRLSNREYYVLPSSSPSTGSADNSSDDGGNQSDPGVSSSVVVRKNRPVEEWKKEARGKGRASSGGAREGKQVVCAPIAGILEFVKLDQEIDNMVSANEQTIKETDLLLEDPTNMPLLQREKAELQDHLEDLSTVKEDLKTEVEEMTVTIRNRRKALNARRNRLADAQKLVEGSLAELRAGEEVLLESTKSCKRLTKSQVTRRTTLITTLASLFPIEPSHPLGTSLLFTIHTLPLPNSTYPPSSLSDETIPSALGYVAQVVSTLAAYMGVPLHYPIQCRGSRSAILDLISVMRGPRAFPLFDRGVERYRFDYGVFLLNKNIEQLMYTQNLIVLDLRNTLPNLKTLLLSLSYDPSHSSFASSILVTRTISPLISLSTNPTDDLSLPSLPESTPRTPSLRSVSPTPTLTKLSHATNQGKGRQNGLEKINGVGVTRRLGMVGAGGAGARGKGDLESGRKVGRIS